MEFLRLALYGWLLRAGAAGGTFFVLMLIGGAVRDGPVRPHVAWALLLLVVSLGAFILSVACRPARSA